MWSQQENEGGSSGAGRRRTGSIASAAGDFHPLAADIKFNVEIPSHDFRLAPGPFMTYYTIYEIQIVVVGTEKGWKVFRRYNECYKLYRTLNRGILKYNNFPPKKFFGNMDPGFIEQRKRGLKIYLQAVLSIPNAANKHPDIDSFFELRRHLVSPRPIVGEMTSLQLAIPSSIHTEHRNMSREDLNMHSLVEDRPYATQRDMDPVSDGLLYDTMSSRSGPALGGEADPLGLWAMTPSQSRPRSPETKHDAVSRTTTPAPSRGVTPAHSRAITPAHSRPRSPEMGRSSYSNSAGAIGGGGSQQQKTPQPVAAAGHRGSLGVPGVNSQQPPPPGAGPVVATQPPRASLSQESLPAPKSQVAPPPPSPVYGETETENTGNEHKNHVVDVEPSTPSTLPLSLPAGGLDVPAAASQPIKTQQSRPEPIEKLSSVGSVGSTGSSITERAEATHLLKKFLIDTLPKHGQTHAPPAHVHTVEGSSSKTRPKSLSEQQPALSHTVAASIRDYIAQLPLAETPPPPDHTEPPPPPATPPTNMFGSPIPDSTTPTSMNTPVSLGVVSDKKPLKSSLKSNIAVVNGEQGEKNGDEAEGGEDDSVPVVEMREKVQEVEGMGADVVDEHLSDSGSMQEIEDTEGAQAEAMLSLVRHAEAPQQPGSLVVPRASLDLGQPQSLTSAPIKETKEDRSSGDEWEDEDTEDEDDGFRAFNHEEIEPKYGVGMVELTYDRKEREERSKKLSNGKRRVQFPDIIDFWDAIKEGDVSRVEAYLTTRGPSALDSPNALGFTPLISAALLGHFDVVRCLVEKGADINATNFESCTALHYAVIEDDLLIARYLIEHGADLTLRDFEGKLPIELTEDEDLLDLMEQVLKEKGLLEAGGTDSEFDDGSENDEEPPSQ